MNAPASVRILLVDDHTLFRESLRRLLESDPKYRVIAEVSTVAEAMEICRQKDAFDLALIDYDLGPSAGAQNGVSVLRCLREHGRASVPALIVAARVEPNDLVVIMRDLHAGVFSKADPAEELELALRKTLRGELWVSSRLALDLAATAVDQNRANDGPIEFDARERQVLKLVVEGMSNKEISARLNISESVVKSVLQRLFEKVGVRTRAQLVRFAFESGTGLP